MRTPSSLAALSLFLLPASSCVITLRSAERSYAIDEPYDTVVVTVSAGDIDVSPSDDGVTRLDALLEYHRHMPDLDWEIEKRTLYIDALCDSPSWFCHTDLDLEVPPGVGVILEVGSGNLSLSGLDGEIDAETGSGNVLLADLSGDLDVETGSGDVSGGRLRGAIARFDTGAGNVDVAMEAGFTVVDVSTGAGDVDLLVPVGAYDIDLDTGAGDIDVTGLIDDPLALSRIAVTTGAGDVFLAGYDDDAQATELAQEAP